MMKLWPAGLGRRVQCSVLVSLAAFAIVAAPAVAQSTGVTFSPTYLNFPQQAINTVSSPLSIVLTNATTADLTVSSLTFTGANSSEFTLSPTDTCTTAAVVAGGTCTINVTFSPTSTGSPSATLIVTDTVGTQTVGISGTVLASGSQLLNLGPAPGGATSATVSAGDTGTYNLQIGGSNGQPTPGFSGTVTLVCSGAPTGATCTIPSTETLTGSMAPTFFSATVSTTSNSGRLLTFPRKHQWAWAFLLIGIVLTPAAGTANRRKGVRRGFISALLFSCLFVVGCSGGGAVNPNGTTFTPTGTYAMTITATSSANSQEVTQTLPITLIVQ